MPKIVKFTVVPRLPEKLERLRDIALNMNWSSNPEAIELFYRIDRKLWNETNQNAIHVLGLVSQDRLEELVQDESYVSQVERVWEQMSAYLAHSPWREKNKHSPEDLLVAYFSAEFGIHESISIYSGGLGVLAGDHLKSASDLGLPLIGVGLLYREGYHRQTLNADGWQQEHYPRNDFFNMPIQLVRDENGEQHTVEVPLPGRSVVLRIWKCDVGRVTLYLLDSDFDANAPEEREITARLYGGDRDMRIRQEIVLGMGGVQTLHALGLHPTVYHMNEGHSAFMVLQRIRDLVHQEGLTPEQALEAVKTASVFTTHTPVPAGNDMFSPEMIGRYFGKYCEEVGLTLHDLLAMGRQDPADEREPFCMTVLALKYSSACNGVSKLHGEVARSMWARTFRGIPESEVPITSITNGVHLRTWISRELGNLFDRYIGPGWLHNPQEQEVWDMLEETPDGELWRTHEYRRERLVNFARRRLVQQLQRREATARELAAAKEVLDPEVLTIGFARRFATYKRATLFMRNPDRMVRILTNPKRPVQLILAGKAHPQDSEGKELIRSIIHFVKQHGLRNQVVFIEDYDINVARYMVQGVDCWLNTPRRPMEASGTSGMKAAANGALNISIRDGWWCEADPLGNNGWSIGAEEHYTNPEEQDYFESEYLYDLIENEVVPLYYERARDGIPRKWVEWMKCAIQTIAPRFNTHRMVQEYADRFYIPATIRRNELRANGRERSKILTEWKKAIHHHWPKVHFNDVTAGPTTGLFYGSKVDITADLHLGELTENDLAVEIYYGNVDPYGRIPDGQPIPMTFSEKLDGGLARFKGSIPCDKTGQLGFMVRTIPQHPDLAHKHETALITWA